MQDYTNGCRNAKGCQDTPTHIYRPQGGFPAAYCVACMPNFLKPRLASLETTVGYEKSIEQMYAALAAQVEEPKKPRRSRKKKVEEPVVDEPALVEEVVEEPTEIVEEAVEEATEETPSE